MEPGKLRNRVQLQRRIVGNDSWGQPLPDTWENVVKVYADVRFLSGKEAIKAGAVTSTTQTSMRIRYRTGLDSGMRVLMKGIAYRVVAVLPDEQRRQHVDLVCEVTT